MFKIEKLKQLEIMILIRNKHNGELIKALDLKTLRGANLDFVNFQGANLRHYNLEGAYFRGANLAGADFRGANLTSANMQRANLEYTNLEFTSMQRSNLRGANLEGANLQGTNLCGAMLEGANLRGAVLPIFCKWGVSLISNTDVVKIGCMERTIKEWVAFFEGPVEYDTRRGTLEFKRIEANFKALQAYQKHMSDEN